MQCSFSRHANIIQLWGYNCNKTTCMYWCKYQIYQNSKKCPKNGRHEFHAIVYAKETHVIYVHATL